MDHNLHKYEKTMKEDPRSLDKMIKPQLQKDDQYPHVQVRQEDMHEVHIFEGLGMGQQHITAMSLKKC